MSYFITNNVDTINILARKDLQQLEIVHNHKFTDNTLFTVCPLIPGVSDYYLIHESKIIQADHMDRLPVYVPEDQYKQWNKKAMSSIFPRCLAGEDMQRELSELTLHAMTSNASKGKLGKHKFEHKKDRKGNKYYKLKYKHNKRYITGRVYRYEDETLFYTDYYSFVTN